MFLFICAQHMMVCATEGKKAGLLVRHRWHPLPLHLTPIVSLPPHTYFSVFHNPLKVIYRKEMLFQNMCQGCAGGSSLLQLCLAAILRFKFLHTTQHTSIPFYRSAD